MLRPFAHPVVCCWMLLRVVAQILKPVKFVVSFSRRTAGSIIVGSSCILFAHYCQHARSLRYERICLKKAREAHLIHKARTIEPLGSNKRDGLYVIII